MDIIDRDHLLGQFDKYPLDANISCAAIRNIIRTEPEVSGKLCKEVLSAIDMVEEACKVEAKNVVDLFLKENGGVNE